MRAKYHSICVKFREDDLLQMRAFEKLRSEAGTKSYSRMIAEALFAERTDDSAGMRIEYGGGEEAPACEDRLKRMEQELAQIKSICHELRENQGRCDEPSRNDGDAGEQAGSFGKGEQQQATMPPGIESLALIMGSYDED